MVDFALKNLVQKDKGIKEIWQKEIFPVYHLLSSLSNDSFLYHKSMENSFSQCHQLNDFQKVFF